MKEFEFKRDFWNVERTFLCALSKAWEDRLKIYSEWKRESIVKNWISFNRETNEREPKNPNIVKWVEIIDEKRKKSK